MEKLIIFFAVLLCTANAFAQHEAAYEKFRKELIEKSDYIFEGVPFEEEYLQDTIGSHRRFYIEVTRTMRGKEIKVGDTIQLMQYELNNTSITPINKSDKQIFFCQKTIDSNGKQLFELVEHNTFSKTYDSTESGKTIFGVPSRGFTKKEAFYEYLSQQKGIKLSKEKRNNLRTEAEQKPAITKKETKEEKRKRKIAQAAYMEPFLRRLRISDSLKALENKRVRKRDR